MCLSLSLPTHLADLKAPRPTLREGQLTLKGSICPTTVLSTPTVHSEREVSRQSSILVAGPKPGLKVAQNP